MRVLVAPMAAMAETSGPFTRAAALCRGLLQRGHAVALCAAEEINYKPVANVRNYYAPIPSPLGMPMFLGKRMLRMAQLVGAQEKRKVNSYEQVLHFVGAIDGKFFAQDILHIRKAIQDFRPEVVYAEFRVAAIVAAKLENVKVVTGYSYPVQKSYSSNPEYSEGVKGFLRENGLPAIESVLDLFQWADLKVDPSSYELEPIQDHNTVFTGPFLTPVVTTADQPKNKIISYMGFGTMNPKTVIGSLTEAFGQTDLEVYIATEQVKPLKNKNITVDKRFDFSQLMPSAVAYINHGGQNSVMTGLMYGVPQIVCPGNVFERRYNAQSVVCLGAGVSLEKDQFHAQTIQKAVADFRGNPAYADNAKRAGDQLARLGGVNKAIEAMEGLLSV